MPHPELESALTDVRRSYRLLQRYQRRVLDLSDFLAREIDEQLSFRQWIPVHYRPNPNPYTNPVERWAWDGLPYYDFCSFYALDAFWKNEHEPGDWMVVIRCTADTGFEALGQSEPDPLAFKSAVESTSLLRVYIYQYTQSKVESWVHNAYGWNDWPTDDDCAALSGYLRASCVTAPLSKLANMRQVDELARRVDEVLSAMQSPQSATELIAKTIAVE